MREAVKGPSSIPEVYENCLEEIDASIASIDTLGISRTKWVDQNGIDWGCELDFKRHKAESCGCYQCIQAYRACLNRERDLPIQVYPGQWDIDDLWKR